MRPQVGAGLDPSIKQREKRASFTKGKNRFDIRLWNVLQRGQRGQRNGAEVKGPFREPRLKRIRRERKRDDPKPRGRSVCGQRGLSSRWDEAFTHSAVLETSLLVTKHCDHYVCLSPARQ